MELDHTQGVRRHQELYLAVIQRDGHSAGFEVNDLHVVVRGMLCGGAVTGASFLNSFSACFTASINRFTGTASRSCSNSGEIR